MNLAIAVLDVLSACLFFAAAVVTAAISRLAGGSTRLWALVSGAFGLFALERGMNALEWGAGEAFAWLDTFQGYLSAAACLLLLIAVADFWVLLRRAGAEPRAG